MNLARKELMFEIAECISRGEIHTADDLALKYNVTYTQAISLLGSQKFIALVSAMSKAKAMLTWHARALPRLEKMVDNPDDKTALAAMKMLGQVTDAIKGGGLEININLESMVKQLDSNNLKTDLSDVLDIEEYRRVMNEP